MSLRPGSESTTFRVGDRVRVSGTRGRYEGMLGTVVSINREQFPSGVVYVEVGVRFGKPPAAERLGKSATESWFRADELTSNEG